MADGAQAFVRSTFKHARLLEAHGGFMSFEIERGFELGAAFLALEKAKQTLRLENYSLSQTTLEQVFLNIASEQTSQPAPASGYEVFALTSSS
jgi:hypothetical protein